MPQTKSRVTLHEKILVRGNAAIPLVADRSRLEQVMNNLISNAIKYSPDADTVYVEIETQQGSIKVSVKDGGIGIPSEMLPMVFERFFRVNESGKNFSGLGLGCIFPKR